MLELDWSMYAGIARWYACLNGNMHCVQMVDLDKKVTGSVAV